MALSSTLYFHRSKTAHEQRRHRSAVKVRSPIAHSLKSTVMREGTPHFSHIRGLKRTCTFSLRPMICVQAGQRPSMNLHPSCVDIHMMKFLHLTLFSRSAAANAVSASISSFRAPRFLQVATNRSCSSCLQLEDMAFVNVSVSATNCDSLYLDKRSCAMIFSAAPAPLSRL